MPFEMVLASNNAHKLAEVSRLFPGTKIITPRELGIVFEFEENGSTFLENAQGKAASLFQKVGTPVLADDSGLCVRALGGAPGISSNRYGSGPDGRPLDTPTRNALLLERLGSAADRAAFFVCCLVLVQDEARFIAVQETVHGTITDAPRGTNGFGYDPLFLLPGLGRTLAELSDEEKDDVSHRGRAARRLRAILTLP
jgi:XTP/dITP diphosphohydrolase